MYGPGAGAPDCRAETTRLLEQVRTLQQALDNREAELDRWKKWGERSGTGGAEQAEQERLVSRPLSLLPHVLGAHYLGLSPLPCRPLPPQRFQSTVLERALNQLAAAASGCGTRSAD